MSNERERLAREWATSTLPRGDAKTLAAIEHIMATTTPLTMADVEWDDKKHFLAGATHKETNAPLVMIGPAMRDKTTDCVALSLNCGYQVENHNLTPNGKKYELREVTDKPEHPVEPSTKTMDEYTLSERTDMVGMWAGYNRHEAGGDPEDFLIITGEENETGRVPCYNPGAPTPHAWEPDAWMLTPRFDMPRAWSTDGDPCAPTVSPNENVEADQPEHPETLRTQEDYENAPVGTIVANSGRFPLIKRELNVWANMFDDTFSNGYLADTSLKVLRWGWGE